MDNFERSDEPLERKVGDLTSEFADDPFRLAQVVATQTAQGVDVRVQIPRPEPPSLADLKRQIELVDLIEAALEEVRADILRRASTMDM